MPKPIKKRVQKKVIDEKEVITYYEKVKNYYDGNKRFVHIISIAVLLVLALITGLFYYNRQLTRQSIALEYEGYRLYHNLYQKGSKEETDSLRSALEKFQRAYRKKGSPQSLLYIANTQFRLGLNKEALETLRKFTEEFRENRDLLPVAYYKIATIQMITGRKEDALKTLDTLYNLKTSPFLKDLSLYESARILEELNRKEDAAKMYELLLKNYPESPYTRTLVAELKKAAKEKSSKEKEKKTSK
jgi:predicted negative regulator of RcsB-dependent stress response